MERESCRTCNQFLITAPDGCYSIYATMEITTSTGPVWFSTNSPLKYVIYIFEELLLTHI